MAGESRLPHGFETDFGGPGKFFPCFLVAFEPGRVFLQTAACQWVGSGHALAFRWVRETFLKKAKKGVDPGGRFLIVSFLRHKYRIRRGSLSERGKAEMVFSRRGSCVFGRVPHDL